jgi:hypothetical protein
MGGGTELGTVCKSSASVACVPGVTCVVMWVDALVGVEASSRWCEGGCWKASSAECISRTVTMNMPAAPVRHLVRAGGRNAQAAASTRVNVGAAFRQLQLNVDVVPCAV